MSTSLILGVVGGAVGFVASGYNPQGAYWGYAAGSTLGGYIDNVNTKINNTGPRLSDRAVQISSYGASIPILAGKMRFAGNVFWSTDLIETKNAQRSGGKGSPQVTNTTYSYSASFAVLLCEGTIVGIPRIWADNKLIYSVGATADAASIIASNRAATGFRVYTGVNTQLPDSLIESLVGIGNCPAYRGVAYIVFENFQVGDYGNRIPQITCEVLQSGAASVTFNNICQISDLDPGLLSFRGQSWITDNVIYSWRRRDGLLSSHIAIFKSVDGQENKYIKDFPAGGSPFPIQNEVLPVNTKDVFYMCYPILVNDPDLYGNVVHTQLTIFNPLASDGRLHNTRILDLGVYSNYTSFGFDNRVVAYDTDSDISAFALKNTGVFFYAERITVKKGGSSIRDNSGKVVGYDDVVVGTYSFRGANFELCCGLACANGKVFALIYDGLSMMRLVVLSQADGSLISNFSGPTLMPSAGETSESIRTDGASVWAYSPSGLVWKWAADGTYKILNAGVQFHLDGGANNTPLGGNQMYIGDDHLIGQGQVQANSDPLHPVFRHQLIHWNALAPTDVTLASILTALCARTGVTNIDVSGITDMVHGYLITRQMSDRAAIEFLLTVFRIDTVERGPALVFVKRGGAPVRTLTYADLGAHDAGTQATDPLLIDRKQEIDLPQSVTVDFTDLNNAYQQGSVPVLRLNTTSQQAVTLNVTAVALTADEAAKIADVSMMESWVGRNTFRFSTSYAHADLEPTDVILINTGTVIYRMRITKKIDQGGMIQWEAIGDDSSVFTSTAVGGGSTSSVLITSRSPTDLELIDSPILQDSDNDAGFYAKLVPAGATWTGASVYQSDAGALTLEGVVTQPSEVGTALTALPPYTGIDAFDESSSVDVQIFFGALVSVTRAQALAGQNAFLIGNGVAEEIIVARNATLISPLRYRLSGMLRNQRATEGVVHFAGERVVSLEKAGLTRINHGSGDIGTPHTYAAVSFGRAFDPAQQKGLTNTARGLLPFSPVQLGAGTTASTDVILNWRRRTRLSAALSNIADAPLGESVEAYDIEIANDSAFVTIKRIFTGVGAPPFTYTATNRFADEAAGLARPFYWRVFQKSSIVGRGTASRVGSLNASPAVLPVVIPPAGPGTWNPQDYGPAATTITFSNANNTALFNGLTTNAVRGLTSFAVGRKYFEHLVVVAPGTPSDMELGFCTASTTLVGDQISFPSGTGLYYRPNGQVFSITNGAAAVYLGIFATYTTGDVIGVAVDSNLGNAWLLKNNVSLAGNPSTSTAPIFTFTPGTTFFALFSGHGSTGQKVTLRTATASFSYAPPTNFFSLT